MMAGGGSGGHITPILAVAHEVKKLAPDTEIIYVGQTGDRFGELMTDCSEIDATYSVRAGKFRRYHGEGLRQLLDLLTLGKNIRDSFYVLIGLWQSFWLLGRVKPDILFCKGGFVGVPIGLAAALRHIPYVTHDSDAIPGLANRIIARWASRHAVALSADLYPYPEAETIDVGVPTSYNYRPVTASQQSKYKREIGLDKYDHILLVTGGGSGAEHINKAVLAIAEGLLVDDPALCIVHTVGQKHEETVSSEYSKRLSSKNRKRVIVRDYINDLYRYSGAADVVVARGGATNLAELAGQGRASIIIPNPILTGGHQTKNAAAYRAAGAIVVVSENELGKDPEILSRAIVELMNNAPKKQALSRNILKFARPKAAVDLAKLLINLKKEDFDASTETA